MHFGLKDLTDLANSDFTFPHMVDSRINLGSAVRLCILCRRLYITAAVMISS